MPNVARFLKNKCCGRIRQLKKTLLKGSRYAWGTHKEILEMGHRKFPGIGSKELFSGNSQEYPQKCLTFTRYSPKLETRNSLELVTRNSSHGAMKNSSEWARRTFSEWVTRISLEWVMRNSPENLQPQPNSCHCVHPRSSSMENLTLEFLEKISDFCLHFQWIFLWKTPRNFRGFLRKIPGNYRRFSAKLLPGLCFLAPTIALGFLALPNYSFWPLKVVFLFFFLLNTREKTNICVNIKGPIGILK